MWLRAAKLKPSPRGQCRRTDPGRGVAREGRQGCRDGLSPPRLVAQPEEADGEARGAPLPR